MNIIGKIKGLFTSTPPKEVKPAKVPYTLELVYDNGDVKAFKFKNPLMLPKCRYALLGQALNDAQLNMTKTDASIYFQKMKEAANNGQWSDVMSLINAMEFYMAQHTTTKTMLAISSALIVLDGEDPEKISTEWMQRKSELFEKDKDFRGFFLRWGYIYLVTFSNASPEHLKVEDYLSSPMIRMSESLFMKLLTENTAKVTSANKT